MSSRELAAILDTFYREELTAYVRHQAGARLVSQYDANNTYQYIINREEVQLSWVAAALADLGVPIPDAAAVSDSQIAADPKSLGPEGAARAVVEEDAREAGRFVERWRPRVAAMSHARHAKMLGVILGEVLEQQRFFEQALAGRTDLLGRRASDLGPARGRVLPTRWVE